MSQEDQVDRFARIRNTLQYQMSKDARMICMSITYVMEASGAWK